MQIALLSMVLVKCIFYDNVQTVFEVFLLPYGILLLSFLLVMMATDHGEALRWLNGHRNILSDHVFPMHTYLGDWVFIALVCVVLTFSRWRVGIMFLITALTVVISSYFLKWIVFSVSSKTLPFFLKIFLFYAK